MSLREDRAELSPVFCLPESPSLIRSSLSGEPAVKWESQLSIFNGA